MKSREAFSLLELVVAIGIIAMLAAIMMPALSKARRNALSVKCMDNHRKIIMAVSTFAADNDGKYPESVATIGQTKEHWNWQEPTMLAACYPRSTDLHRSLGEYLRNYLQDASVLLCPTSPEKYKFLHRAWEAGDDWDNPDTLPPRDPMMGTYCFYWNYIGFLPGGTTLFKGPQRIGRDLGHSHLLMSDYFGYGHWRNKLVYGDYKAYGSCERFSAATSVTPGTEVSSAFWSCNDPNIDLYNLGIALHAGYTDGHVKRYSPGRAVIMEVSKTSDGTVPYPAHLGPGKFYLPEDALY
jgi:type II secretory pathway pseudopilin PulG